MAPGDPTVAPLIALLTDFGPGSVYVGAMKGVIVSIAPAARIIDLGHGVTPQAVDEASFLLGATVRDFPEGTLFVVVVDPGVGSSREVVHLEAAGRAFLAPDNGALSAVLEREGARARARWVRNRALFVSEPSATFHGRDVLAPVAARLAIGAAAPADLGPEAPVEALVRLGGASERDRGAGGRGRGRIVHVDPFGNLVSDVPAPRGRAPRRVDLAGREIERAARTYADATDGEPFAYVGSFGTVEIALPLGNAARALGAGRGAPVEVWFEEGS